MVQTLDGDLVEIAVGEPSDVQDRAAFHAELRGYAAERGYKAGWAAHKYREKYGTFPPFAWNGEPAAGGSQRGRVPDNAGMNRYSEVCACSRRP